MMMLIKTGKSIGGVPGISKPCSRVLRIDATTTKLTSNPITQSTLNTLPIIAANVLKKAVIEFIDAPPFSTKYYINKH